MADNTVQQTLATLPLAELARAVGPNPRTIEAFKNAGTQIVEVTDSASANTEATAALQDASVLTLSSNATLTNERVVQEGEGISFAVTPTTLEIATDDTVPHVMGGFRVQLTAVNISNLVLPIAGTLSTLSGVEVLTNKALNAPRVIGIADYADDTAAAAGGVPVGGVYRTASALKIRVT